MEVSPRKKGASPKKKVEQEVKEEIKVEEIERAVTEKIKEEIKEAPPSPKKRRIDGSGKFAPSPSKVKRGLELEEIEKVMREVNMKDDVFFENDPFWVS
jgi:hypothetical protein